VTTGPAADDRTRARRELTVTVLLVALGALVQLVAVGRDWYTVTSSTQVKHYPGTSYAGAVKPLALAALAGAAALLATRRRARTAVGALLVVVALGAVAAAVVASFPQTTAAVQEYPIWRFVVIAGALPVLVAGVTAVARGARWSEMSARYDAPGTVREKDPDVALWDALDQGDDPTG
jgi:uncharacterized membrane protein (TIGR02234 family)